MKFDQPHQPCAQLHTQCVHTTHNTTGSCKQPKALSSHTVTNPAPLWASATAQVLHWMSECAALPCLTQHRCIVSRKAARGACICLHKTSPLLLLLLLCHPLYVAHAEAALHAHCQHTLPHTLPLSEVKPHMRCCWEVAALTPCMQAQPHTNAGSKTHTQTHTQNQTYQTYKTRLLYAADMWHANSATVHAMCISRVFMHFPHNTCQPSHTPTCPATHDPIVQLKYSSPHLHICAASNHCA